VENPREIVSQGDQVHVRILEVDAERRRLSLSLKRVEDGMPVQPKPGEEAEPPALGLSDEVFADEVPAAEALEPPVETEPEPVGAATGASAAGKSEALRAFGRPGAAVISSDDLVHRLYREDAGLQHALRERWGDRVFRDGEVDREEIGRIVFADRAELAWLES